MVVGAGLLALSLVIVDEASQGVLETLAKIGFRICLCLVGATVHLVWICATCLDQSLVLSLERPKRGHQAMLTIKFLEERFGGVVFLRFVLKSGSPKLNFGESGVSQ